MAGNNSIQILRGTRESLVTNRNSKLLAGQLLYNDTDNYLTIGRLDNNSVTTSAPICCRSIKGYLGEDNGLSVNSTDTLVPYSLTTNANEVVMTVNNKVGFTVHKNGHMNLFMPATDERHPIRYAEYIDDMAKKVDKQSAIVGLYTFYGKRKLPTQGDEWIQYENGEECVFRGGYFPNSYSEFDKGDRRVVMYGKMGTFSVDMAEDRGFTYDSSTMGKQVTNRNYVDSAISAEAATRAAEDADIRAKLSAEVATRTAEDSKLQDYIDQEIQTRAAEDSDIRDKYVPRTSYSGNQQTGQEYKLYGTGILGSAQLLDVQKGAVSNTIMMRNSQGSSSVATPTDWKPSLSTNAQTIVNFNMLTEYVEDYVVEHAAHLYLVTVTETGCIGPNSGQESTLTVSFLSDTEFTQQDYINSRSIYLGASSVRTNIVHASLCITAGNFNYLYIVHRCLYNGMAFKLSAYQEGTSNGLLSLQVTTGKNIEFFSCQKII